MSIYTEKIRFLQLEKETQEKQKQRLEKELADVKEYLTNCEEAQNIILIVADQIQKQISTNLENIANMFIKKCFPSQDLKFKFLSSTKRNAISLEPCIIDSNDNVVDIKDSIGGGLADILSWSLRLAFYKYTNVSNVIILDEPFKFLSSNLSEKASQIIRYIIDILKIQLIVVSHRKDIFTGLGSVIDLSPELIST